MTQILELIVANRQQSERITLGSEPIALGRNPSSSGDCRTVTLLDSFVSRNQLLVSSKTVQEVNIQNLSQRISVDVDLPEQMVIGPGDSQELTPPIRLRIGETLIEIASIEAEEQLDQSMKTIATPVSPMSPQDQIFELNTDPEMLIRWFETLVTVQRAATGSDQFYQQTARATVDLIGLDQGMVILRNGDNWTVAAEYSRSPNSVTYSRAVLKKVVKERRTFYQLANSNLRAESLENVTAIIASPVFDADGDNVIGAVYGVHTGSSGNATSDLSMLHAQLVQVLAAVVGSGLARQESEAVAARRHVQFEQFVSPEIVRELDRNPQLLDGSDREITTLFVDIRNFSRLSEKLSAEQVCDLVRSIMDRLVDQVRKYQGTTVSYLGDGLMAIWNAPVDQSNHAELACRAAIGMLSELPHINEQWMPKIGTELRLGIGINTGHAMVGNTGSQHKPHYGPLGHHVNLASRVEGATKQLGVPILITEDTRQSLDDTLPTRRLCQVRVMGIAESVPLYELYSGTLTPEWGQRQKTYELALGLYESGQWNESCNRLISLLNTPDGQHDSPTISLLSRAVECMQSTIRSEDFDPVWNLSKK